MPTVDDMSASSAGEAPSIENVPHLVPLTEPADGVPAVIDTEAALDRGIAALSGGTGPIAVDAERAGGYRYGHGAYLVQMRREGSGTHLIDPLPFEDLAKLSAAISRDEWILHAASQDIPCLTEVGLMPGRLFDTEIAARLLGRPRVGLAALAESELGFSLAKEHSAADWSTRPLPQSWLRYAALDVELLGELRDRLKADLASAGRLDWAEQEFDHVRQTPTRERRAEPWRRTSGIHKARSPRQLAVIRELWEQRDKVAQERDVAPGRVLPDAAIAAVAIAKPGTKAEFATLSVFQGRAAKRRLDLWWSSYQHALALPNEELPNPAPVSEGPPPPRSWQDRSPAAAARLAAARAAITEIAGALAMPAENVLLPDTVRRLCWDPPTELSPETVTEFLKAQGARGWQITLTSHVLFAAISTAGEPGTPEK